MHAKSRGKTGNPTQTDKTELREGLKQRDPREAQKMLDEAIEASMPTSDAIAVVIPDVKLRPEPAEDSETDKKK